MPDNDPGWSVSETTKTKHRVMRHFAMNPSELYWTVDVARALEVDPQSVAHALDLMDNDGLLHPELDQSLSASHREAARLTPLGLERVNEFNGPRPRVERVRACTDAVLGWLADLDGVETPALSQFRDSTPGQYFGEPFDRDDVREAGKTLLTLGLIKGWESMAGLQGVSITTLGSEVIEDFDGSVRTWRNRGTGIGGDTFHVWNSPGANVASRSAAVTQTSIITTNALHDARVLADRYEAELPGLELDSVDEAKARNLVAELREELAEPQPEPGRVRRLLRALGGLAYAAAGNAAGSGLFVAGQAIIEAIGN